MIVLAQGQGLAARLEDVPGYLLALAAALFWSSYSVLSRRVASVARRTRWWAFCFAVALLLARLPPSCSRPPSGPRDATQWLAVLALGLGPVGAAFYAWDIGCKKGDIRLLGVAAYSAPVISTLALIATGYARPTLALGVACALIVAGALVASADKLGFRRKARGA